MNQDDLGRAIADLEAAKAAGFTPKQPIYPIGTPVNEVGVANFKASRQEWDDLPLPFEAFSSLITRIEGEKRIDTLVEVPDLVIRDGLIQMNGSNYPISKRAFQDLCTWTVPGGGPSYLAECPQDMREEHLNFWLRKAYKLDARASKRLNRPIYNPLELKIRSRDGEGIFGVTGPRHTSYDLDQIAKQLIEKFKGDARVSIIYDGYKATIDVLYHTNVDPHSAVAGEFFKVGLRIQADDAGHGSIKVKMLAWRNLCKNLIVIDFNKLLVGSRRHQGEIRDITRDLDAYIEAATRKLESFISKWNESNVENVLEKYDLQDVETVLKGLVYNKVVHVAGVRPAEMLARLTRAWQMDPGYSKASVINAITRAAHENPWSSTDDIEDLESTAGELLFAKVWRVEIPESANDLLM